MVAVTTLPFCNLSPRLISRIGLLLPGANKGTKVSAAKQLGTEGGGATDRSKTRNIITSNQITGIRIAIIITAPDTAAAIVGADKATPNMGIANKQMDTII